VRVQPAGGHQRAWFRRSAFLLAIGLVVVTGLVLGGVVLGSDVEGSGSAGSDTANASASTAPASEVQGPGGSRHPVDRTDEVVREQFRLHATAGADISPNFDNYASRTNVSSPLLLFLPATGFHPSEYTSFLSTARAVGYHVLALDYWNVGSSVARICKTNAECYGAVQRNRLDGTHPGPYSAVDPQNSIVNRLTSAIRQLEVTDPKGGWERFVSTRGIDWGRIVVAGHSQGGGESAYIAHVHPVRGVLMFSSPVDSDHGVDASWMHQPGATPPSRMYGFDDTGDEFASRILPSWNAIGLGEFGRPANTAEAPPYASHELLSHLDLGGPTSSHLRDITNATPRTKSGESVFEGVWKWMLTQLYR
jgi:pimeloyl-ACP methyl ester carboxylesterase